ncbi:hypothetical protein GRI97_09490 [Altererythrobacter xixiisoli]|uniref:Uncharacterized protein n=1 Tax=Croceibacterium xixiisoli TaxID=1476466 RepID=A0A6I4TVF7_9SPHN|nr:hypothetical protein [Croceibacterium xixiisoli]MXO99220.1 hypothetical protein [Croceibacterium xixiisoli]
MYQTIRQKIGVAHNSAKAAPLPLFYIFFVLLLVFNIALPKGGIAVGVTPITFGYLLIAVTAPVGLLGVLLSRLASPPAMLNFILGYVPIASLALLKIMYGGSTSALMIYTVVLVAMPAVMFIVYAPYMELLTEDQLGRPIVWCIRFAVLWGLMNFVIFAFTRTLIEVQFLTVNPLDAGEIYSKNNRRGILMKLVSTYNNGNLYGVCMGMLAPIYFYFERSRIFIAAFCLAMLLTLSRTVWFGMIFIGILMAMLGLLRVDRPVIWYVTAAMALMGVALLPLMGWTAERVVETDLGGRMIYWDELELSALGSSTVRISEVLYAGLLQSFGILGTILALFAFAFPIIFGIANISQLSRLRRSAMIGLCSYLMMAASDAAFIFPPTIAIYMFVATLVYRRGYAGPQKHSRPVPATAQLR